LLTRFSAFQEVSAVILNFIISSGGHRYFKEHRRYVPAQNFLNTYVKE
jgi:hypothetical protein